MDAVPKKYVDTVSGGLNMLGAFFSDEEIAMLVLKQLVKRCLGNSSADVYYIEDVDSLGRHVASILHKKGYLIPMTNGITNANSGLFILTDEAIHHVFVKDI